jgi:hypothetical protein
VGVVQGGEMNQTMYAHVDKWIKKKKKKGKEHYHTHSMMPVLYSFKNQTKTQQKREL